MKQLFISALILFSSFAVSAQIKMDKNGNYVATGSVKGSGAKELKDTGKTFTDAKGAVYPVLLTSTGRAVVRRTSKKTGNEYLQYLPTSK